MANYTTGYLLKKFGSNGDEIFSAKSATLTIDDLQISDDKAFVLYEDCKATAASYSRDMTSTWGTLCLPFAIDATADGNTCKFYTLQNVGSDYVTLKQIEEGTIEAGTPVVICKKDDSQTTVEIKATDAEVVTKPVEATTSDRLVGTFGTEILKDNGGYFIAKNKFFSVADYSTGNGVKVNPFRAYIMCSSASAPALRIDLNDDATGIDTAKAIDTLNNATAEYYDINGRRTTGVQKGLNIVRLSNGKTMKVFVK